MATLIDNLLYPIIYLFNRSAFMSLNKWLLVLALRLNGCGITWTGRDGISDAEARFIRATSKTLTQGTFFDVGANVGHYSRALRKYFPYARIWAFEPHPEAFKKLYEAVDALGVSCVELAVGEKAGVAQLFEHRGNELSTVASLEASTLDFFGGVGSSYDIKLTTIDEFCETKKIEKIDFLKVDTEGFDLFVLRGAARMLRERKIGIIEFEFVPACLKTRVLMKDFIDLLDGHEVFRLALNGSLIPLNPYDYRVAEQFMTQNLIAMPK
jgi:FkbM family methyltransferase